MSDPFESSAIIASHAIRVPSYDTQSGGHVPTLTTHPDAYRRHNISDEELSMLSIPSNNSNYNNALWGSVGAMISLAPNAISAAASYCEGARLDCLSMLNIIFFCLALGVAAAMYFVCRNKEGSPQNLADKIRQRTAHKN